MSTLEVRRANITPAASPRKFEDDRAKEISDPRTVECAIGFAASLRTTVHDFRDPGGGRTSSFEGSVMGTCNAGGDTHGKAAFAARVDEIPAGGPIIFAQCTRVEQPVVPAIAESTDPGV